MLKNKTLIHIRNLILFNLVLFFFATSFAQEIKKKNNKFSLEMNMGSTTPFSNLSKNYYANYFGFVHLDLGSRYMLNQYIGAKLDIGFDRFKNDEFKVYKESLPFNTLTYRANLNGIINVGKILRFSDWTKKIGMLAHGGFGLSMINGDSSTVLGSKNPMSEAKVNVTMGFSPQVKLSNRIALNLDLTFVNVINQKYNFDFRNPSYNKFGMVANVSAGMAYYIGKNKTHLDWNFKEIEEIKEIIIPIKDTNKVLAKDTDKDGIIDSLDLCPLEFGLKENKGCPETTAINPCDFKELPIITFANSSVTLTKEDILTLDSLANCLMSNTSLKLVIHGHSDNIGDKASIDDLANRRARAVKDELVKKGIDKNRLTVVGNGSLKAKIPVSKLKEINHNRIVYFEKISNGMFDIKELETNRAIQGLFYTVQVAVYRKALRKVNFSKYGKVLITSSTEGYTRYSIGVFRSKEACYEVLDALKKDKVFSDAFITSYYLGERITIKKSQELLKERGDNILEK